MRAQSEHQSLLQRLRAAGLTPTATRIAVFQVVSAARPGRLTADAAYGQLDARGLRMGLGTVYRVLQELHAGGLLAREWGPQRKALYSAKSPAPDIRALRLVCPDSGRRIEIEDEALLTALRIAAARNGVELGGCCVTIAARRPQDALPPTRAPRRAGGARLDLVARPQGLPG